MSNGESNIRGTAAEREVRRITGGEKADLAYATTLGYDCNIDADCVLNRGTARELILTVTHCNPSSPRQSLENKFQNKLGEMWLWKTHDPRRRVVVVIFGLEIEWTPWTLEAFRLFFDDAIFQWEENFEERLRNVNQSTHRQNLEFWQREQAIRNQRLARCTTDVVAPNTQLKYGFITGFGRSCSPMREFFRRYDRPESIPNQIVRVMCQASAASGNKAEWNFYKRTPPRPRGGGRARRRLPATRIVEKRSFFNYGEAAISVALTNAGIPFLGGIQQDVEVPNALRRLANLSEEENAFTRSKMSEDFVLNGIDDDETMQSVYIQSKSSGGGDPDREDGNLARNIHNRSKEQVARNLLYRTQLEATEYGELGIESGNASFIWIGVLDGDWRLPSTSPRKHIHMLILAGYDHFIGAGDLVDHNCQIVQPGPLVEILNGLGLQFQPPQEFSEVETTHNPFSDGEPGGTDEDHFE
jgi:hypothetical protein